MRGYIPLPAFRAPGPLNFSGLDSGIDALGKKLEQNRLLQQQKDIGTALSQGGYGEAADKAFGLGDLKTGLSLTQAEESQEDRDFNRNRLLAQDRRSAASDARSRELHGLKVQEAQTGLRDKLISRVSGIAQMIRNEQDPTRKQQMVQAFTSANPRIKAELDVMGFDPANPDPAMDMILAEARGLSGGKGNFSKTPVYGTDAQGNTVLLQVNDQGMATQTQLPQGVNVSTGIEKIDLGDRWGIRDKRSGALIGYEPKNIAGAEAQKVIGKAEGEATVKAPELARQSQVMLSTIDDLLKDPYLSSTTGTLQGRLPNVSGAARRVQSRLNQLQGQLFLKGYQDLKGGGAISDFEAGKAEQALARIGDSRLNDDDYIEALKDLRDVVEAGMSRAQSGVTEQSGQRPVTRLRYNPATGELE